jgi:hypothetical protein
MQHDGWEASAWQIWRQSAAADPAAAAGWAQGAEPTQATRNGACRLTLRQWRRARNRIVRKPATLAPWFAGVGTLMAERAANQLLGTVPSRRKNRAPVRSRELTACLGSQPNASARLLGPLPGVICKRPTHKPVEIATPRDDHRVATNAEPTRAARSVRTASTSIWLVSAPALSIASRQHSLALEYAISTRNYARRPSVCELW